MVRTFRQRRNRRQFRFRSGWQVLALLPFLAAVISSDSLAAGEGTPAQKQVSSRSQLLEAERQEKAKHLERYEVTSVEKHIRNYEKRPWFSKLTVKGFRGVRLELGGLSRESGFAFGVGYSAWSYEPVQLHARALYSTKGDSRLESRLGFFESGNSRFSMDLLAASTDQNQMPFYGVGPESNPDSKQSFELGSRILSFEAKYRLTPHLELGGGTSRVDFQPNALPEMTGSASAAAPATDYWIQSCQVRATFFDHGYPKSGLEARLGMERYSPLKGAPAGFSRYRAAVETQIPLGSRVRRLAAGVQAAFTAPDAGQEVPFYLLEKLGGSRSLRGFAEHRFQDLHRLLFNVEYRWEVWTYMDFVVFGDLGKVFHEASEFNLSDLRRSAGFGVLLHAPTGLRLRLDLARSTEGFQFHLGVGPLL